MSVPAALGAAKGEASLGVGRLSVTYTVDVSGLPPDKLAALVSRPREARLLWEARTRQFTMSFAVDQGNKAVSISIIPRVLYRPPTPDEASQALMAAVDSIPSASR